MARCAALLLWGFVLVQISGCAEKGPDRFRISGEVTFDGKPIPYGDILFTPDGAEGNSGPQGIAPIKDGRYDTTATSGQGIAGGPTVLRVTGLGSADGTKLLCVYEFKADLPRKDSTLKVEVPAS